MEQPYWYTLDPESHLITSDYGGSGCSLDTAAVMRWECLDDDVNKYAEVLCHLRGMQTLHEVTGGRPERGRIYRDCMAEVGLAQEMLVALRAPTGEAWGTLRLNRGPGQPEFDTSELRFMATVSPHLAGDLRVDAERAGGHTTCPEGLLHGRGRDRSRNLAVDRSTASEAHLRQDRRVQSARAHGEGLLRQLRSPGRRQRAPGAGRQAPPRRAPLGTPLGPRPGGARS
jgi:hypothetical protein